MDTLPCLVTPQKRVTALTLLLHRTALLNDTAFKETRESVRHHKQVLFREDSYYEELTMIALLMITCWLLNVKKIRSSGIIQIGMDSLQPS